MQSLFAENDLASTEIEVLLSLSQLHERVEELIGVEISRTTLYRWRRELGLQCGYSPAYAQLLAYFGQARRNRKSVKVAQQITKQFGKEHGL